MGGFALPIMGLGLSLVGSRFSATFCDYNFDNENENEDEDEDEDRVNEERREAKGSLFLGSAALSQFENDRQAIVAGLLADSAFQVSAIAFVEEIFVVHKE